MHQINETLMSVQQAMSDLQGLMTMFVKVIENQERGEK